jgi:hypothetical protein
MTLLVKHERPVDAWLATLPADRQSTVIQFATFERSIVLSYLYASMLGMEVSIEDWEGWARERLDKLDHRGILESEIIALQDDIASIRAAVEEGKIRLGDGPTKISYLSRELRGHIEHLSKEMAAHDRKALLTAGIEIAGKYLRKVFGKNSAVMPSIEAALEAAWSEVEFKNAPK